MLKAAIDIGTNSTRLYIAKVNGGAVKRVEKSTMITRLGREVDSLKRIGRVGIERNIEVLLHYKKIAQGYGIENIRAIATSAVRDAVNRQEFIEEVRKRTGIDVDVISGKEEAELGFLGASSLLNGKLGLVCDIGGGSTEFIWGEKENIYGLKSIDVGAVRITERHLNTSLINKEELDNAEEDIRKAFYETLENIKRLKGIELVCIGGTATTLAAMAQELSIYDIDKVHGYKLTWGSLEDIFKKLVSLDIEERKKLPGLQSERADIMPAGALILKVIMEDLQCDYALVSESDNLDGVMIKDFIYG